MSAAAPAVTEKVKFVREYQPTDRNGLAIGPKQRFEADTLDELVDKIAAAHQAASAKVYETIKAAKLGDLIAKDDDEEPVYDFQPRALTADERVKLTKDLVNPETAPAALENAISAVFGAPVAVIREQLRENTVAKLSEKARVTVDRFIQDHPEYIPSPGNQSLLIKYMQKHNMSFNKKNLESAYQDLRSADLLTVQAPRPAEPKPAETPAAPAPPVAAEPATPPAPAIPAPVTQTPQNSEPVEPLRPKQSSSGLSRADAGNQPPPAPAKTQGITINDINRLTSDQYAEALREGLYEYAVRKDPNTGKPIRERVKLIMDAKEFADTVNKLMAK